MIHQPGIEKPPGEPRFVELKEACRYGRMGHSKMYDLLGDGIIVAVKMGRKTLIDLNSVDAYHRSLPRAVIGAHRR